MSAARLLTAATLARTADAGAGVVIVLASVRQFGGPAQGSLILASQFVMHRDARFWPDAERFIPDRWLSQSVKEATQRFVYFPFGGGVRRCIGESFAWTEGVLLLAVFAASWKLRMVPDQRVGLQPMITLRPKYGMRMATSRH